MENIKSRNILDVASNKDIKQALECLLEKLQELTDLLTPGAQIKRLLAGIRKQIKNQSITQSDLEDLICAHILNIGWWNEQTSRTYKIACIYTAIAQIKLEENETNSAMNAMLEASSYYGLSAGFSHPRRIAAEEKSRAGAIAKSENKKQKIEKLIEFLEHCKPDGGWTSNNEAAKSIAPYFQKFTTQALEQPQDTLENTQAELLKLFENEGVNEAYKKTQKSNSI
ncbi:hypothetical protein [Pseudomonas aeruginosa]|uniref:hypothetical protein n=1 Tax=Pseudomonas aeruginosa TaxID=287 RepID=UPI0029C9F579|nr:hypothetical protein [Pseudomonas aeruginosa]